jgi:transcriptional regulator with XRE-family HTH domain
VTPELVFVARIKAIREAHGTTQADLAAKVGLDPSTMTRIERGQRGIALGEACAIASALGSSLEAMLGTCPCCGNKPHRGFTCNTCGRAAPLAEP